MTEQKHDRIFLHNGAPFDNGRYFTSRDFADDVEYIRADIAAEQLAAKDVVINTAKIALTIACRYAKTYDQVPFIAGEKALKAIGKELGK